MRGLIIFLGMAVSCNFCYAQNSSDDDFESFRNFIHQDFESFRSKINKEYAEFVRNPWKPKKEKKQTPKPKDEVVPPVTIPEKDRDKQVDSRPVVIEEVVKPVVEPTPQPSPLEPIEEQPQPVVRTQEFVFFGTLGRVRIPEQIPSVLRAMTNGANPDVTAKGWSALSDGSFDNMLKDCLDLRNNHKLCDWAYLEMLVALADIYCGDRSNASTLLASWLYAQSGYKMRMATESGKLFLLFASRHHIYGAPYFEMENVNYYPYVRKGETIGNQVQICGAAFPKEQPLSLLIPSAQLFDQKFGPERTIRSKQYPNATASVKVNQNLMDFYSTYPTSMIGDNIMTRWAMYANTPMATNIQQQLYPQLRSIISGKTQLEAVNILLNWVQTGFEYEFDDKLWGGDRAFFAEESLNYPYCDCEDRSILFTRLVRDLLGLKCILVFYPEHLSSAVRFTENVNGDYIQLDGQKYIVSDPTYIGAPVGMTMPDMNNQTAKVILLE